MLSFGFFSDPALTTPVAQKLHVVLADPDYTGSVSVYFGSPVAGRVARAMSAPGVSDIQISSEVVDGLDVRLALSATAFPGASGTLALGPEMAGGVGNAVEIHVRVVNPAGAGPSMADISLQAVAMGEWLA
ncbi:MAG: hypothetical protein WAV95_15790 [Azonexus sp.]